VTPALVLFDVNETLADLAPLGRRFAAVGGREELVAPWLTATLRDGIGLAAAGASAPFAALARAAAQEVLSREADPPADLAAAADHVLEGMGELTLQPGAEAALEILRDAGVRVATLTNGAAETAAGLFERAGVADLAQAHLSALDFGRWKPAPEPYRGACARLGVDPSDAALVAVHPWDVDGAQRAGLTGAWVDAGGRPYPEAMLAPDVSGRGLVEVARALVSV
jgi:2-haloacid dehalogenase